MISFLYVCCHVQCFQKQKGLEKLQEENAELKVQVKEHSQELLRLSSDKRKVELELSVIIEKHRTTQQEVCVLTFAKILQKECVYMCAALYEPNTLLLLHCYLL